MLSALRKEVRGLLSPRANDLCHFVDHKRKSLGVLSLWQSVCVTVRINYCAVSGKVLLTSLLLAARQDVLVSEGMAVNTGLYKIYLCAVTYAFNYLPFNPVQILMRKQEENVFWTRCVTDKQTSNDLLTLPRSNDCCVPVWQSRVINFINVKYGKLMLLGSCIAWRALFDGFANLPLATAEFELWLNLASV